MTAERLWLDANVVLRFLTREPPDLAERSAELMRRAEQGEVRLVLGPLIVAEIVWVLRSFYELPMDRIADVVTAFVSAHGIETEERSRIVAALALSRDHNVDFIDAMLALRAAADDETVCTFDHTDFKRLPARWTSP